MIHYKFPAATRRRVDHVFMQYAGKPSEWNGAVFTQKHLLQELQNNMREFSQILESAGHFPDCYSEPSLSFWYLRRPAWNGGLGLCRNLHNAAEMFYYLRTRIEDMQQLRDRYDHLWNLVLDAIDETAH